MCPVVPFISAETIFFFGINLTPGITATILFRCIGFKIGIGPFDRQSYVYSCEFKILGRLVSIPTNSFILTAAPVPELISSLSTFSRIIRVGKFIFRGAPGDEFALVFAVETYEKIPVALVNIA